VPWPDAGQLGAEPGHIPDLGPQNDGVRAEDTSPQRQGFKEEVTSGI
jgi:hypothetical protein